MRLTQHKAIKRLGWCELCLRGSFPVGKVVTPEGKDWTQAETLATFVPIVQPLPDDLVWSILFLAKRSTEFKWAQGRSCKAGLQGLVQSLVTLSSFYSLWVRITSLSPRSKFSFLCACKLRILATSFANNAEAESNDGGSREPILLSRQIFFRKWL